MGLFCTEVTDIHVWNKILTFDIYIYTLILSMCVYLIIRYRKNVCVLCFTIFDIIYKYTQQQTLIQASNLLPETGYVF